jgi:hypothetical protein
MTGVEAARSAGEPHSAIAWGAVVGGAVASLAMSFVLLALAAGFGFQLAAPWPGATATFGGFTSTVGALMIAVQVISSALGGYLAGRLRTKWLNLHSHEAHFRDTAHGFLVWAVATLVGVILVATVLSAPMPISGGPAAQFSASRPLEAVGPTVDEVRRAANLASQVSFFMGFGMLLSAFSACVAAALGGLRRDEMFARYWAEEHAVGQTTPT